MGRPLSAARKAALETLLPILELQKGEDAVNPPALFPHAKTFVLEIGFGNGEHLLAQMQRHPDYGFIGIEPFINGMSAFLKVLYEDEIHPRNVRVVMGDAIALLPRLPPECLNALYILNPDPWPKARHIKRRIVRQETLDAFARVLIPGGLLIMTTDVDFLAAWMVRQAAIHPSFIWCARKKEDWQTPPLDWVETRYEAKGRIAGRRQTYLIFSKRAPR